MNIRPELVPGAAGTRNCGGSGLGEVDSTSADVGDSGLDVGGGGDSSLDVRG